MKTVWVRTSQTSETGGLTSRTEFIYGDNNQVTEAAVWVNGAESARYAVECDENSNFIRWISHDQVQEYTYDASGHLLSFNTYSGETLNTGYEFTYDDAGNRTRLLLTIDRLGVTQRTDYIYDENGHNIRQEVYLVTEYIYDGGTETQVSRNAAGEVVQTIVITRDSFGNIIRTESYSGTGALLVTETTTWKGIVVPIDCPKASI